MLRNPLNLAIFVSATAMTLNLAADCKNPWDINHGMTNPPMEQPSQQPGQPPGTFATQVKGFDPNMWKHRAEHIIPAGTVLTTILEHDLSSGKNKQGDTFVLTLQDGFILNGKVLIPPNSHIVGGVQQVVPAKSLRGGFPGRMQVALQALVFPNGQHMPIYANIESNPNAKPSKPPIIQNAGMSLARYGQSLAGMGASFIRGPGFMMNKFNRGADFKLTKGEAIGVKLSQDLNVPEGQALVTRPPYGGIPGTPNPYYIQSRNGQPTIDPKGPIQIPSGQGTAYGAQWPAQTQWPPQTPGIASEGVQIDPNQVFNQPLKPQSNLPDPF